MSREIQSRVIIVDTNSSSTGDIEDIVWANSEPSGLSNELNKNRIFIYYLPHKFPNAEFIKRLKNHSKVVSVRTELVYKMDWNRVWQESIKPVNIGNKILVVPPFKRCIGDKKGRIEIIINPAMAFGTGHHESTKGIMKMMYKYRKYIVGKMVADFGSGSGILSILARKLGCSVVDAYDIDPECGEAIRENIDLNKVDGINFFNKSIRKIKRVYEVIFANMLFNEIASNKAAFLRSIRRDGLIFFAGILDYERDEFVRLFDELYLKDEILINGWRSFLFKKL
ncbi:MAG: 50S ribosomal protein L11 methyltransferase [Deltaproteobacteria bacterium]|nr:50S ribosomal protein L11 methyltransferase [Deltaproteobacteria bacterium]